MHMEKSVLRLTTRAMRFILLHSMPNDNICKFVPSVKNAPTEIWPVNFVLENTGVAQNETIRSVYAMHLGTRGNGELVRNNKRYAIDKGDVFFTLPSDRYAIRGQSGLEYAYVSFLGGGAAALARRIMPDGNARIFGGNERLIAFWKQALAHAHADNIDLMAKSVLEYSAALLIVTLPSDCRADVCAAVEEHVRKNFTSSDVRLRTVAARFGYSEQYLSKLFYRTTGTRFTDYLADLRVNAACKLLREGNASVKEVAYACGFSDPLYFSKVFKRRMGAAPSAFGRADKKVNILLL